MYRVHRASGRLTVPSAARSGGGKPRSRFQPFGARALDLATPGLAGVYGWRLDRRRCLGKRRKPGEVHQSLRLTIARIRPVGLGMLEVYIFSVRKTRSAANSIIYPGYRNRQAKTSTIICSASIVYSTDGKGTDLSSSRSQSNANSTTLLLLHLSCCQGRSPRSGDNGTPRACVSVQGRDSCQHSLNEIPESQI